MEIFEKYLKGAIGCMFMAFTINGFIVPHGFLSGGFAGLAIAGNSIISEISVGTWVVLLNVPLLIWAYFVEGKVFVFDTILTIIFLGTVTDLTANMPILSDDIFVCAIFGGVFEGVGIGLCYRSRISSGGTELLARLVLRYVKDITPGKMIRILSLVIVGTSVIVTNGFSVIYYTLIEIYVATKVSDVVIIGGNQSKMCLIITNYPQKIRNEFIKNTYRGMTMLDAKGAYTDKDKGVLITVLNNKQVGSVKKIVKLIDPQAFVIISEVSNVLGKGFVETN